MYITYLLLAVTILISVKAIEDNVLKGRLLLNPYDVTHFKKWYRTFTHAFIHADWMHLGFNMYVLYSFGEVLEKSLVYRYELWGHALFAFLYLSAILMASLYSINKHKDNPSYNALGASGAVMAVLFAFILMNPTIELGLLFLPIYVPAYIFGPLILVAEYFLAKRGGTGIAHDAHISGAIYGVIFMSCVDLDYLANFLNHFTR
ncbi:rhomboid family intramembrane serine protease [Crocinitomix algicola]|uniref:rhomboid family intramembrane serine protease n=1 Tax=Crocinitomix algicola TaxID=1740263 RepID=UPI0008371F18|nr:rhomboid family intramembrane serine protease [Crocinitomix algicola]